MSKLKLNPWAKRFRIGSNQFVIDLGRYYSNLREKYEISVIDCWGANSPKRAVKVKRYAAYLKYAKLIEKVRRGEL